MNLTLNISSLSLQAIDKAKESLGHEKRFLEHCLHELEEAELMGFIPEDDVRWLDCIRKDILRLGAALDAINNDPS